MIVRDTDGRQIRATVIAEWERGSARRTVRDLASTSGGTAFTFLQGACSLFNADPSISRIILVSTRAPLALYLLEREGQWWDVLGKPAFLDTEGDKAGGASS